MEFRHSFLFLATIFVGLACGQMEGLQFDQMFKSKRYCGKHLADVLSEICRGKYNDNSVPRNGDMFQKKNYLESQYMVDMPRGNLAFPFQKRSEATSLISNYRRRKRRSHGVSKECCEKSCTREELASYCALPFKRRR